MSNPPIATKKFSRENLSTALKAVYDEEFKRACARNGAILNACIQAGLSTADAAKFFSQRKTLAEVNGMILARTEPKRAAPAVASWDQAVADLAAEDRSAIVRDGR